MKKYWIAAACLGLAAAIALLVWLAITRPAKIAARNLEAINGISAGQTTEAELLGRKAFQTTNRICIQESCFYHMEAENTFLNRLRLAPRTFIGTNVGVRDGVVTEVSVFTMRTGLRPVSIRLVENLPKDCASNPCLKLPPKNPFVGIRIMVDNRVDVRNHLPEAVNAQCLAQRSGCAQYAEFIPLMRGMELVETPAGLKLQGQK